MEEFWLSGLSARMGHPVTDENGKASWTVTVGDVKGFYMVTAVPDSNYKLDDIFFFIVE